MDPALEQEWQRRIQDNQDVQQAKVDLEFHRAKIRQMQVRPQFISIVLMQRYRMGEIGNGKICLEMILILIHKSI